MLVIESPIQTVEKFSEVSGLTVSEVREMVKNGEIETVGDKKRGAPLNVAKYANNLINQNQTKTAPNKANTVYQ